MYEMLDTPLDTRLDTALQAQLSDGERVVWAGQPTTDSMLRRALPSMLFGLVFAGFGLYAMGSAWGLFAPGGASGGTSGTAGTGSRTILPGLFGIPFAIIGMGLVLAPIWMRRRDEGTVYAITDRRAIVMSGTLSGAPNVRSFMPEQLGSVERRERADGMGDLVFERIETRDRATDGPAGTVQRRGFMRVRNVAEVERKLNEALGAVTHAR